MFEKAAAYDKSHKQFQMMLFQFIFFLLEHVGFSLAQDVN